MLTVDPTQRIQMNDILTHPWFTVSEPLVNNDHLLTNIVVRLPLHKKTHVYRTQFLMKFTLSIVKYFILWSSLDTMNATNCYQIFLIHRSLKKRFCIISSNQEKSIELTRLKFQSFCPTVKQMQHIRIQHHQLGRVLKSRKRNNSINTQKVSAKTPTADSGMGSSASPMTTHSSSSVCKF